jgi:hypothetical protein
MIIKRWDTNVESWVEHYPKTTTTQLYDNAGNENVFDNFNKIKPAYLPDAVFDSLIFYGTTNNGNGRERAAELLGSSFYANRSVIGYYYVVSSPITLTKQASALTTLFIQTNSWLVTSGSAVIVPQVGGAINALRVGMFVSGPGIQAGTTISSIGPSSVTLSANATSGAGDVGITLTFQAYVQASISFGEESNLFQRSFTLTNGSTNVTSGNTSYLKVGMIVSGTGIQTGSTIVSITNATTFVLSSNATSPGAQSLTFTPTTQPGSVNLEIGDWFIITQLVGSGTSASPYTVTFSIVNNTYELMKPASSTLAGSPGLVPASAAGDQAKFLRADGSWQIPINTTYNIATETTAGLVELSHAKITAAVTTQAAGTVSNRYYGVRLNNADQMIVNVPWENTTYSEATTTVSGLVEISYAKQTSERTIQTETITSGRFYGITLNNNGQAIVNVPWENTTYAKATTTSLGLVETAFADLTSNPSITATDTTDRYYGVQLNQAQQMVVNVPWEDTQNTAGVGISLASAEMSMTQPHVVSADEPATTFRKANTLWFDI